MKAFFSVLFCIPLICLSQQGWVVVTLQADQYSGETSWLISDETGFVGEESPGVIQSNSFNQQVVFLPAGEYTFTIFDSFGDGICCGFGEGWFSLTNACGVDTAVYDFNTSELTIPFEILPCPPPIFGVWSQELWITIHGPMHQALVLFLPNSVGMVKITFLLLLLLILTLARSVGIL